MRCLVIFLILIGLVGLTVSYAHASCVENTDWPQHPCLDTPPYSLEEQKQAIGRYYDYKGSEWMEEKKSEMIQSLENEAFREWVDIVDDYSHWNVYDYYSVFEGYDYETYKPSEFIVQNVEFMQDVIYPNELGFYEVEITDQNGSPIEMFVTGRIDYEAPWGQSTFSPVGNYDKQKQRFVGELTAPGEIIPGTYTLKLDVHGLSGGPSTFSGITEVDFIIGERPDSFDTLFEPSSLGSLMGKNRNYSIGESIMMHVQLVQGHFYSAPLPNHPASILVYGTDWQSFVPNLLEVYEVTSDSNGFIDKELFLDDRTQCDYDVKIISEHDGFEDGHGFRFDMANTEIFNYSWENEKIPVIVEGQCSIPLSMIFDQSNKTMTIELDTSDSKKTFGIHFPHRLLDGDLIVLVNGDVDFDNFSINKTQNETIIGIVANSNHTKVEIIGTSAIPEFETIVFVIFAVSMMTAIVARNKLTLS